MKKIMLFLLTAAMLFSFSACSKETPSGNISEGEISDSSQNEASPNNTNPDHPSNDGQNFVSDNDPHNNSESSASLRKLHSSNCWKCSDAVCYTDNGYYHVDNRGESKYDCLFYFDFATLSEVAVCSDSSCKHDNINCAAVFSNEEFFACHLFVSGEYLYCLSAPYDTDGSMSAGEGFVAEGVREHEEKRRSSLYRMKLDGTEREKLWQADEGDIVETGVYEDGSGLWFVTKTPTAEKHEGTGAIYYHSKNRALVKYGFSEKAIVERIPLDDHNNIALDFAGACGEKFILYGQAYPGGGNIMDFMEILAPEEEVGALSPDYIDFRHKCELVFFTLDSKTKELKEFYRGSLSEIYFGFELLGDTLYIPREDNSLFTLNIFSGEMRDIDIPGDYEFLGIFGGKLKLLHITPDWSDNAMYFADLDGSNMTKSELMNKQYGDLSIELCAAIGDMALVIYDEYRVPSPDNSGAYSSITPLYALISLDDLFNGRENYLPFEMAGGENIHAR